MIRHIILSLLACMLASGLCAQSGCKDPLATNYNASATSNDGSCTYPITHQTPALKATLASLMSESSGLEWINGHLYTFNDSGGAPYLYQVDTATGSITGAIHVTNYGNTDWEDITADSSYIYIGDFGNNNGDRIDLKILKIALSQLASQTSFTKTVTAQAISFHYTDQTSYASNSNTDFDCESLISIGDTLYLFSKNHGNLQTRVYQVPKTPGSYSLTPYTTYNVNGMISGADYNPVNREIELIGYMNSHYNAFVWHLSDFHGNYFFSGNKRRIEIGNGTMKWQTEGIAFYNETNIHRVFISCEATSDINAGFYVISDSNVLTTGLQPDKDKRSLSISYRPDRSIIVDCAEIITGIELSTVWGQDIQSRISAIDDLSFAIMPGNPEGLCILKVRTASGNVYLQKIVQ